MIKSRGSENPPEPAIENRWTRETFLKEIWVPYPPMPPDQTHYGRLVSLVTVSIDSSSSPLPAPSSPLVLIELEGPDFLENLRPSDRPVKGGGETEGEQGREGALKLLCHLPEGEPWWAQILRPGDIVSLVVEGGLRTTHTTEPLPLRSLTLLAPYNPHSPYHSNTPEESARGGDSQVNRSWPRSPSRRALSSSPQEQRRWSLFLRQVRDFFTRKGFTEITTPSLVVCPGTEPSLEVFRTAFFPGPATIDPMGIDPNGTSPTSLSPSPGSLAKRELFLPTSPELHLKKALSKGYARIFEIRSCFRNGEVGPHHQPEFFMLEWYRAYATLDSILQDLKELVGELLVQNSCLGPWPQLSIAEAFKKYLGRDLSPSTSAEELRSWIYQASPARSPSHYPPWVREGEWNDLFHLLYLEMVEPALFEDPELRTGPFILHSYPPSLAAMARLNSLGWADRFEMFWEGLEIANAFHELNAPETQLKRFQEDLEQKKKWGRSPIPLDPEFLEALREGIPPSGGIALGLERLYMALYGLKNIGDLRVFPYVL